MARARKHRIPPAFSLQLSSRYVEYSCGVFQSEVRGNPALSNAIHHLVIDAGERSVERACASLARRAARNSIVASGCASFLR
ncbi:MAG: hypothetical protein AAGF12_34150 [Myxococcota bacterium]